MMHWTQGIVRSKIKERKVFWRRRLWVWNEGTVIIGVL